MTQETPRERLEALIRDTSYPFCGGSGEYVDCDNAEEIGQEVLGALRAVIGALEDFRVGWEVEDAEVLANRLEKLIVEHLEFIEV